MALLKYILKKMLMLLPVLVGISIVAFALGIMSPGDPVDQVLNPNGNESYTQAEYDAMAAKMGLDQPAVVQYFNWVDGLAHGDLGRSFFTNKSVMDQLAKRIPISLKLAGFSMILTIGGTPYNWIMDSELPALSFADFNSVMLVIIGVCANGAVALITLILVIILAWNYLKLLLEAAERYVLLGVLVYTAPVAFSMGASQTTSNIWKSWCRMLGGQIFLLLMNAWCLRLFTSMVGSFISNPLSL